MLIWQFCKLWQKILIFDTVAFSCAGVLALIDRNFQGFGKELFTDAGKYVIHFGSEPTEAAEQVANTIAAAHPDKPRPTPPVTALAKLRTDVVVVPTQTGNQLV